MSTTATVERTPNPKRPSLFLRDLASPTPSRRFATPSQAAAVSALRRENFASAAASSTLPPPPPVLSLDDRHDFSPDPLLDLPAASPESFRNPRPSPPPPAKSYLFSSPSPIKTRSNLGASGGNGTLQQQSPGSGSWWSPGKNGGGGEEKGRGSPVDGVMQPGALITLPPPREVARPEMRRDCLPVGEIDEEEWVTVYGFSAGDINLVLREFEKCGVILKHISGPRDANWIHILYQSRYDAQKALAKHGQQLNSVLIIGVKPVDPWQRQYLDESLNNNYNGGFIAPLSLQPAVGSRSPAWSTQRPSPHPYLLQNSVTNTDKSVHSCSAGAIASPTKSVLSKVMDLMFGI
ncbi:nuclear pore complex protein NUP35-like [Typha latifolia]|uniref:nuclear pore complex protein NUP35-like n=1 Tax=Typha latifolia TaxID=4733 RepID=UPI003C2BEF01